MNIILSLNTLYEQELMTGDHGRVEAHHLLELLGGQVPLLGQLEGLVDPRLQVQAVLHPTPVTHLQ